MNYIVVFLMYLFNSFYEVIIFIFITLIIIFL